METQDKGTDCDDGDFASWWEGKLAFGPAVDIGLVGDTDFFDNGHD